MSNRKMKSQNSFRSSPCILSQEKKLNYNPNPRSIRIMIHYVETFSTNNAVEKPTVTTTVCCVSLCVCVFNEKSERA